LLKNNRLVLNSEILYTFSGIAIYHPRFFIEMEVGVKMQLLPLLKESISKSLIKGELFKGIWSDIGTPERLEIVNKRD
jgi:MurNAc alpha-1-phosphate uridylyltransferase